MDTDHDAGSTMLRELDNETLEQLHRTTTELVAADSVTECTRETVSAAVDILGCDWCGVAEADEGRGQFEIVVIEGEIALEVDELPFDLDQGLVGTVYQEGGPKIVNDVTSLEEIEPTDDRVRSAITVPVGEWGICQALRTEPDAFTEQDLRLLELLVAPLGTTVERIQRESALRARTEELQRQNDQIEAIHAVSTAMKRTTEKSDIYDMFIATIEQVLDISICSLNEYEEGVLKTRAVGSEMELEDFYTETQVEESGGLASETYLGGETVVVNDLAETEYSGANPEYRSVISVPLGEWGIAQATTTERNAFDETDRQLLELLCDAAEGALERIERQQELRRRARQLEQRNEQLDQFASRLSHEMRNPLSVLEARHSLARETGESEHFEHMERSIRRMNRLIDDTLALARGNVIDVDASVIPLADRARECWEGIRTPNTELVVETDTRIRADEDQLHQLLSNLFRNAVEHTGDGVTVTVNDLPQGFYVEDDGPGIPPADREAVLSAGTTSIPHGTGLGLAVVRRVAEAHDWSLRLCESPAGGARFEFRKVTFAD